MKITLRLHEKAVVHARKQAAQNKMRLSRFVSQLITQHWRESLRRLREAKKHERDYLKAMKAWRAKKPLALTGPTQRYSTRDEIYDRPVLRRR
jgi:hypothetical protein